MGEEVLYTKAQLIDLLSRAYDLGFENGFAVAKDDTVNYISYYEFLRNNNL